MSTSMDRLAKELKAQITASDNRKTKPYDSQAEVLRVEGNIAWVHIPGGVQETPVRLTMSAKKGDMVNIHVANGTAWITGNSTSPPTDDTKANFAVQNIVVLEDKTRESVSYVNELISKNVTTNNISASTGYIEELTSNNITAESLVADHATVNSLDVQSISAATAYVNELEAGNVSANDIIADHATVDAIDTTYATIASLEADEARISAVEADTAKIHNITADQISAATGYVGSLKANNVEASDIIADHATVGSLNSNYAHITNGVIDNATIDYADVDNLNAHYASIDLANVNNAWIQNGVVKDAAISDAQIIGVSANKLTAGTIDASNITVTNLNADNITAGSISVDGITIDIENNEATIDGEYIEDGTITMNGLAQSVQNAIDGAIETHTGTVVPTLNNAPASSWTTTKLKDSHVGDIYYVINAGHEADGYCYRFAKSGSTYSWVLIQDSDVTAALSRLTTAEGKIEGLETFESETSSWITETDEELSSVKTNVTSLSGRMDTAEGDIQQKVDTSTFNTLSQTVGENSSNITTLTTITENNGLTTSTNITNTVNSVSQTASGNSSKISQLTTTLGTNADGTTKTGDIVHRTSAVEQDLSGFKTTVEETYATQTEVDGKADADTVYTKSEINQTVNSINASVSAKADGASTTAALSLKANKDTLTSEINASADTVKINANRVNITGTAVFNAVNNDTSASAAMLNSNIEIGGRNLLSKTKEFTTDNTTGFYMTGHNAPFSSTTYNGLAVRSYPSTTLSSGSKVVVQYDAESIAKTQELIKLGETYVCSFWAKGSGKMNLYFYRDPAIASWVASDGTTGTNNDGAKVWTLSSSWERYWIVWTTNASATYTNPKRLLFRHDYSSSTATLQVDLCGIKLEKGNKATDWSPAPEDVQAEIDTKKNVHTLLSGNSSGTDYSTILDYAKEGATGTFSVNTTSTPITNVKVDDSVRLGYYVSDMGTAGNRPLVYINATVTAIPSATQITIKAHGLDTTIIDGGNIITNSIGANQLNTNNINNSGLLTTGALTVGARSDVLNSNIQVGGRNLFGYGSQCKALDGFWTVGAWNIATEDGYQCAHTSGAKSETRYLQSKLPFYPRPNETVAISAFVKIKNISYGTTNPMCEFYLGGQTIDGTWRSQSIDAIYVDGVKVAVASTNPVRFTNYISDTNWHHIALVRTWQNYAFTDNMLPSVYLRDATGDLYVRNIKYERGNKATDWTTAPEDVDAGIANAANTANSYLSVIDGTTGISVHNAADTNNFVNINSDGMKVYKGGATDSNVVASFEDTVTIGKNNGSRVYVAPNELTMLTEDGLKAVQIDSDGATQTVVKQNELHLKFRDGVTPSSGTSVTHTVSSEVQSGENVYYQVYSKAAQTGHWTTVSIKKGTASSGTVSNGSTNLYTYSYAGNSTSQKITFTGANILFDHEVMTEYYMVTQIAPKTSIGGILTLGQNSDVSNGDNVLVVGNGSDPQFPYNTFEVRQDGITMVRNDLYVDGFIYANYATHSSPIGTIKRAEPSAAVSVPDKTFKALCSVSLEAGTWIVICTVRAPSNATGFRMANLSTTAAVNACNACIPAVSANVTQFDFTKIVEPTATIPYYLNVYHNAGTPLSYPTGSTNYITAIRIL